MERNIAVIDLKAFYSFVECIDRGLDPFTTPLVVADKQRGKNTIVLSVSPYLKAKGIPSRLRIKELPKNIEYIYAIPRMERYIEKSAEVVRVLLDYVSEEDIHVYSIDEAFIDINSYLTYYKKSPLELVKMIINAIKEKTGLTATGGIGDNFFLAKVALDVYAKKEKDGIAILRKSEIKTKLWPITPLNKIWGIGSRTEAKLNALGINNVGQLANSSREYFKKVFGIMGEQLIDHANGIDDSDIHEQYIPKETSLSQGQVLFKDYNYLQAPLIIKEMCDDLSSRLRNNQKLASVVSLYIGYAKENDGGFSRQMSLLNPTDDNEKLKEALLEIYNKNIKDLPIRNIGINFSKLKDNKIRQGNLFENMEKEENDYQLNIAMDILKDKYGKNILLKASALLSDSTVIERNNQIGGHRK